MILNVKIDKERYDTRMYCNLVYTNAFSKSASAIPLHMHLILPRGDKTEKFPLIIYLGGGGWRVSSPERHLPELAFYAAQGYAVASVEYRTTANSRFPAQIEDVKTAIRYLRKHCNQFQIDPLRVYIMGGSAGEYLAAMTALTNGTDKFRGSEYLEYSDNVSGAVCLYGIYDFLKYKDAILNNDDSAMPLKLFLPETDEKSLVLASPVSYVSGWSVPFLLLHGTEDTMVSCSQSIELHNLLEKEGANVELYLFDNAGHADPVFSQAAVQNVILNFLSKSWR